MNRIRELFSQLDQPEQIFQSLEEGCRAKEYGFADFFRSLWDLELEEEIAQILFKDIQNHAKSLASTLGRPVGFRASAVDFLLNVKPILKPSRLIEWDRYEHLLTQSSKDSLTGLYNRRYFEVIIEKEQMRSKRYGYPFSIIYIDLDDFKRVNDSWGHAAGDEVLKGTASVLQKNLRTEDCAARFGGEEFVVLLPQTDAEGAMVFANRLIAGVKNYPFVDKIPVTFSGGIASFPRHGDMVQDLLQFADQGLYEAKMQGKDRVLVMQEGRRESKRYVAVMPLSFEVGPGNLHGGTVKNISLSGLAMDTDWEPQEGQEINLRFYVEDGERVYDIRSRIVWLEHSESMKRYTLGVRYCSKDDPRLFHAVSSGLTSQKAETI